MVKQKKQIKLIKRRKSIYKIISINLKLNQINNQKKKLKKILNQINIKKINNNHYNNKINNSQQLIKNYNAKQTLKISKIYKSKLIG